MRWLKNKSSLALLTLLVASLLASLALFHDSLPTMSAQFAASSAMRPIFEFHKGGSPPIREYSLKSTPLPKDFTHRGMLAMIYTNSGNGRRALKAFYSQRSQDTMLSVGGGRSGYSSRGVFGYCRTSSASGFAPLYRLSRVLKKSPLTLDHAYALGSVEKAALIKEGYKSPTLLCFASVGNAVPPLSSMSLRSVIEWRKGKEEFQYRLNGANVKGFLKRASIGLVLPDVVKDSVPLQVYSLKNNPSLQILSVNGAYGQYTRFISTVGYCYPNPRRGYEALVRLGRWNQAKKRVEFGYATNSMDYVNLLTMNYVGEKVICYIRPVRQIHQFSRKVGSQMQYNYQKGRWPKLNDWKYDEVMPVVLFPFQMKGFTAVYLYLTSVKTDHDCLLWAGGPRKKRYIVRAGLLGYCSMKARKGFRPIFKLGRYSRKGVAIDNAYTVNDARRTQLVKQGFKNEGILCYARE